MRSEASASGVALLFSSSWRTCLGYLTEGRTSVPIESIKKKRGGVAATALQLFEESMIRFCGLCSDCSNVVGVAYKAPPVTPLHPLVPVPEAGAAEIKLALSEPRYFALMVDAQLGGSGLKAAF
jgi:hypothetical protein